MPSTAKKPALSHTANIIPLGPADDDLTLHVLAQDQTSYLLVHHGRSILIDCHSAAMRSWIASRGLPMPEMILHTHVGPEHCREADLFPDARILVPAGLEDAAADNEAYRKAARPVWDHPEDWPTTMGRERYGVAGCPVILAPEKPLRIAGSFKAGERIDWQNLSLEVVPLPAHGFYSVGLLLRRGGSPKPIALFIGDLFRHGPHLVDIHNLETSYGQNSSGKPPPSAPRSSYPPPGQSSPTALPRPANSPR
ncbi:MAG: MBL fold metallo-hydrolase [Planctomycetota bacterium]|nr:MBL fold metallo-hydrolase [Planctomycetota bacterium]